MKKLLKITEGCIKRNLIFKQSAQNGTCRQMRIPGKVIVFPKCLLGVPKGEKKKDGGHKILGVSKDEQFCRTESQHLYLDLLTFTL